MIRRRELDAVMISIDQINVVNPRSRGEKKFRQIVGNISRVGLKKPITVVRSGREDKPYDLVCGQGRIEACRELGEAMVPALVLDATREEALLMSLAENLARRRPTCVEMLREIANLRERGYTYASIATKTDLHRSTVKGIVRLMRQGEYGLLQAVEAGKIPISIAVKIATSSDAELQKAMKDAYEDGSLRGSQLLRARRLIEARRAGGKAMRGAPRRGCGGAPTRESLMEAYRRETSKQRLLVQKAKVCEARLLFVESAIDELLKDERFVKELRSAKLDSLPERLARRGGASDA